ncbi:unnamed protein product [Schistosoma curassoni]|uniref:PDZ domain-containing protein n=1 Tax=Schistosoma curassoni TaxID=6186 RepID=A0A183JKB6_9TREM|nr:unnamed protein product [Schistosoma curassoni]
MKVYSWSPAFGWLEIGDEILEIEGHLGTELTEQESYSLTELKSNYLRLGIRRCKYATLAIPIRAFTSTSDPPCSPMMLHRYVNVFTSSKSSPSIVVGLVHAALNRKILLFPLCILRSTAAEAAATLVVFSRICCCVCDRRSRSYSLDTRSSSQILLKRIWSILAVASTSAFSASAGMLSGPAALPLLICLMAMLISSIVGGPTSIGSSVRAASMLGGFSGAGRFRSSLKCSAHLFCCSSMLVITLPSLLFTGRSGLR